MDREDKDMTYFKTFFFFHYLMFYFMTNPSERTKRSLIQSYHPLLYFKSNSLSLLSSIPPDLGHESISLKFKYNNLQDLKCAY